jgi:hypothetical protein
MKRYLIGDRGEASDSTGWHTHYILRHVNDTFNTHEEERGLDEA